MTKNLFPYYICEPCGSLYGNDYPETKPKLFQGSCEICGHTGTIVEAKEYGWPLFPLNHASLVKLSGGTDETI